MLGTRRLVSKTISLLSVAHPLRLTRRSQQLRRPNTPSETCRLTFEDAELYLKSKRTLQPIRYSELSSGFTLRLIVVCRLYEHARYRSSLTVTESIETGFRGLNT